MAEANPRLLALNTALGHTTTSIPLRYEAISQAMEGSSTTPYEPRDSRVEDPPLSPLTIERINAEIAECYAYYYAETSSDDEIPVDPMSEHRPPTPYHVPDTPPSDSPSTHHARRHHIRPIQDVPRFVSPAFTHADYAYLGRIQFL
jgi:hypothetical protein